MGFFPENEVDDTPFERMVSGDFKPGKCELVLTFTAARLTKGQVRSWIKHQTGQDIEKMFPASERTEELLDKSVFMSGKFEYRVRKKPSSIRLPSSWSVKCMAGMK